MNKIRACCFLLTFMIFCTSSAIGGKCTGKWAIHACGGGNGKRSDADLTDDTDIRDQIPGAESGTFLSRLVLPLTDQDSRNSRLLDSLEDPDQLKTSRDFETSRDAREKADGDILESLELKVQEKLAKNKKKQDELLAAFQLIKRIESRKARSKLRANSDVID